MKKMPKLATLMTPFPYSIDKGANLDQAIKMMGEHKVRHLPVTQGHELVGMVSDRDLKGVALAHPGSTPSESLSVSDICHEAYVVDLNAPLDRVLLEMAERHIGSAIVTREGKLAGVFTSVDACRSFGEYLQAQFPSGGGNEAA